METAASALEYNHETRKLFIGLDNGKIEEFTLAEDYNRITHMRSYLAHQNRVTAIMFSLTNEWVLSCGRDKYFQWHCSETGRRIGGYQTNAWCVCLEYDVQSQYAFLGDYSGQISVLKIGNSGFDFITNLKGHSGSVRFLAWDGARKLLFSGSFDQSIIVWDIGGQQGTAFELQGHHDKIQSVIYATSSKQLLSSGDDSLITFWNMDVKRQETPEWAESDMCQKCNSPFFWNLKSMWEQKTMGVRQHHCRKCGMALCDKCSPFRTTIPVMGFEYDVRVCDTCHDSVSDADRAPMASFHDAKHGVKYMCLDEMKKRLLTVGKDRVIKLWDVSSVLC